MNLRNVEDWRKVRVGSTVSLSDEFSLLESKNRGKGLKPLDFTVERVTIIKESKNLVTWIFADINDGTEPLKLMVKIVDANADFRLYATVKDFPPIHRQAAVEQGMLFLFAQPHNVEVGALKYNGDIFHETGGNKVTYLRKPQGELNGLVTEIPARSGMKDLLATVVEYSTNDKTDNPELLVLEIGNKFNNNGGEIAMYLGTTIQEAEIAVLPL